MSATTIVEVFACEGFSNRIFPSVLVTVKTENGASATAACTPGESVGHHEVPYSLDGGPRWNGMGVRNAARTVNEVVAPALIGMDAANQQACDAVLLELGKERLGGNATAAVSLAVLKAGAKALDIPLYAHIGGERASTLPCPSYESATGSTRYGGPATAGYKPTYSYVAYDFPNYSEAVYGLWETVMDWADMLSNRIGTKMSHNAGMAIPTGILENDFVLWDMMAENIAKHGYENKVGIQVDMAAQCFFNEKTGLYEGLFSKKPLSRDEMMELVIEMPKKYPFVIIEDPLTDDDFEGYAHITKNTDIQIVGDDLFASHLDRIRTGAKMGAGNCALISTSQIGTVSEIFEVAQFASETGFGIVPCASRGEGYDVCDFAVGLNCGTIRETGLSFPGNRMLKIEEELGHRAHFYGKRGIKGSRFQLR